MALFYTTILGLLLFYFGRRLGFIGLFGVYGLDFSLCNPEGQNTA
jgi:hypothetical protein